MPVENIDGARRYRSYILRKKMSPFVYALVFILISCKSKCARASGSKMLPDLMLKKRKEKKKAEFDESAPVIRRNYSALLVAKRISSLVHAFTVSPWRFLRIQLSRKSKSTGLTELRNAQRNRDAASRHYGDFFTSAHMSAEFFPVTRRLSFMNKSGFLLFQCKRTVGFHSEIRIHAE
jgi:hypothetical protein